MHCNIIPFGDREQWHKTIELAEQVSTLDFSDSDQIPCLLAHVSDGQSLHILNENREPWFGGYHPACLFDLSATAHHQSKTYVKHISQFVRPLLRLTGHLPVNGTMLTVRQTKTAPEGAAFD